MNQPLKTLIVSSFVLSLASCAQPSAETASPSNKTDLATQSIHKEQTSKSKVTGLLSILAAQPDAVKARYDARHPQETITFFGIGPGMTVVEALPGGGWYSKLLLPLLGTNGQLIGADYAADMYPKFGFFSNEVLESKKTWVDTWTTEANTWRDDSSAAISAFQLGSMPASMDGSADAVVFIRALHNLARFENDGGYLTGAFSDAFKALKSGGIVGIVQHHAPEEASDEWASGQAGYLKKSFIIARMQDAGFEFVDTIDVNQNVKDQPTEKDIVWRLPPSFATSDDNPELKEEMMAIGESNRMTLKFRKP
jgi:predicted methyltransferase